MDDQDYEMFKIVVIGDSATGKTNIANRFVKGQFTEALKSTVGVEFLAKVLTIKNAKVKITFWDTAGQERYKSLSKVYYKGAAGIIIVYDITNPESYVNVESWMKLANENLNIHEVKLIVVGNKCDLEEQRKVSAERAKSDYSKFDIECFETSAKTGQGVDECIMHLINKIFQHSQRVKGSVVPFQQDEYSDDENEASNMESIIEQNRVSQQQKEQGFKKPTANRQSVKAQPAVQNQAFSAPQQPKAGGGSNNTAKGQTLKDPKKQSKQKKKGGCC